jgi:hypothetical protein
MCMYVHGHPALLYHQAQLIAAQEAAAKHRAEYEMHTTEAATAHASTLAALQVSVYVHCVCMYIDTRILCLHQLSTVSNIKEA